jgi:acetyltransferase-like isoleucine patch superfamily enzyme
MKRLAIIGSALGGGAAQIIEALRGQGELAACFILDRDPDVIGKEIFNVPVIGATDEVILRWDRKEFDQAIIAIGGDLKERKAVYDLLVVNAIPLANVVDPDAKLGMNVTMGSGNVILNHSYLGNNVRLGDNNYILNQCSLQHDTIIGDHNYLATNVTIGAKVRVGSLNRFGIKSIVESRSVVGDSRLLKSGEIASFDC